MKKLLKLIYFTLVIGTSTIFFISALMCVRLFQKPDFGEWLLISVLLFAINYALITDTPSMLIEWNTVKPDTCHGIFDYMMWPFQLIIGVIMYITTYLFYSLTTTFLYGSPLILFLVPALYGRTHINSGLKWGLLAEVIFIAFITLVSYLNIRKLGVR